MVNKARLIRLTQKLVQINSENPPGDESRIARFVKNVLSRLKADVRVIEFKKRRCNVVAVIKGRHRGRSLLITPHLDTVPAGRHWKMGPFLAKIKNNRIYGLGATDCKGNLACALEAINSIVEDGVCLDYNLVFSATADEESGSDLGLIPLLDKGVLKPDLAVVLDSEDFEIIVTQKGLMHLKVKLQGRRAHGAYPERGINAIDIAVDIIKEIKTKRFSYKKNKYLKGPTLNIGTINGGDKVNIVADWCEFEIDLRFLPDTRPQDLLLDLRSIVKKHAKKFSRLSGIPNISGKIEIEGVQQPYLISPQHSLVTHLKKAMRKFKISPVIKGSEGATVITFFQDKNIPAIATGFGSSGCAHIADEYVKIDNLYKGALVLEEFLREYKFN